MLTKSSKFFIFEKSKISKKKYAVKKIYFFSKLQQSAVTHFFKKNHDKTFSEKKKMDILKCPKKIF